MSIMEIPSYKRSKNKCIKKILEKNQHKFLSGLEPNTLGKSLLIAMKTEGKKLFHSIISKEKIKI
jgi:23S rRNA pseudoU1915 N3-methylase RlmH